MAKYKNFRTCGSCGSVNAVEVQYCAECNEPTGALKEPERLPRISSNMPSQIGFWSILPVCLILGPSPVGLLFVVAGLVFSLIGLVRAKELKTYRYGKTKFGFALTGTIFHGTYLVLVLLIIALSAVETID